MMRIPFDGTYYGLNEREAKIVQSFLWQSYHEDRNSNVVLRGFLHTQATETGKAVVSYTYELNVLGRTFRVVRWSAGRNQRDALQVTALDEPAWSILLPDQVNPCGETPREAYMDGDIEAMKNDFLSVRLFLDAQQD